MHTPRAHDSVDVFAAFPATVEERDTTAGEPGIGSSGLSMALTGGIALATIVLGALAFVVGLRWGMGHVPGPELANPLVGVVSSVVFAVACGALLAMAAMSLTAVALGIPFVRRHARR